jgi:hypothetical protein
VKGDFFIDHNWMTILLLLSSQTLPAQERRAIQQAEHQAARRAAVRPPRFGIGSLLTFGFPPRVFAQIT